jgi:isoamylase
LGKTKNMAERLVGSAPYFDHDGRAATSSLNFLTAHDGFTLQDTVSYNNKHNLANGEDGRDGHSNDHSDNMGVEGPTDNLDIIASRNRRKRNMIATLMLSQGTPMMLAGDELGNSQQGNNNAYCQDNELSWVNWPDRDDPFFSFCKQAIAFRKAHPILSQSRFLHSRQRRYDGESDLFWRRVDGSSMQQSDWDDNTTGIIIAELRTAAGSPEYVHREGAMLIVLNSGPEVDIMVPTLPGGQHWVRSFDTSVENSGEPESGTLIKADSVVVFCNEHVEEN